MVVNAGIGGSSSAGDGVAVAVGGVLYVERGRCRGCLYGDMRITRYLLGRGRSSCGC